LKAGVITLLAMSGSLHGVVERGAARGGPLAGAAGRGDREVMLHTSRRHELDVQR
jgi:hypothetical protein